MGLRSFLEVRPGSADDLVDLVRLHPAEHGQHIGGGVIRLMSDKERAEAGVPEAMTRAGVSSFNKDVIPPSRGLGTLVIPSETPFEVFTLPLYSRDSDEGWAIVKVPEATSTLRLRRQERVVSVKVEPEEIEALPDHLSYMAAVTVAATSKAGFNVVSGKEDYEASNLTYDLRQNEDQIRRDDGR